MPLPLPSFRESHLYSGSPIRSLGLAIAGTRLEPIVAQFELELRAKGITRLRPTFYLSTEWGVPFGTIAIGIPFYLARPDLTALHGEEVGHVEGFNRSDILRYLRHEMGHVVNYAYKLYEDPDWIEHFGAMTRPYEDDYRPEPFSRRFVRHLPGWYAQKHPDEDWSETFAVWLTPPRHDWRQDYGDWAVALAKLEYCDRTMARLSALDPLVTNAELDEDVGQIDYSLQQYYEMFPSDDAELAAGLDGALLAIFEDLDDSGGERSAAGSSSAASLMTRYEMTLIAEVYRWTGHLPERTRGLLRHLVRRAEALQQVYPEDREKEVVVALTIFVASLAMNFVHRGAYFPESREGPSSAPTTP